MRRSLGARSALWIGDSVRVRRRRCSLEWRKGEFDVAQRASTSTESLKSKSWRRSISHEVIARRRRRAQSDLRTSGSIGLVAGRPSDQDDDSRKGPVGECRAGPSQNPASLLGSRRLTLALVAISGFVLVGSGCALATEGVTHET